MRVGERRLRDDVERAVLDRAKGDVGIVAERLRSDHDDGHRLPRHDLLDRFDAVLPRHLHVHRHEIGREGLDERQRLEAVFPFADDLDVPLGLEYRAQSRAADARIVDDDDPQLRLLLRGHGRAVHWAAPVGV